MGNSNVEKMQEGILLVPLQRLVWKSPLVCSQTLLRFGWHRVFESKRRNKWNNEATLFSLCVFLLLIEMMPWLLKFVSLRKDIKSMYVHHPALPRACCVIPVKCNLWVGPV